ncbi:hypothetical protein IMCC3317_05340 [Kordia antarctica]|uniref:Plasmid stabilization system protein n=1 Tax=Kordia antarctica TaxID=1218801 RepID=A0A7L4ZEP0_9FLAO|nr:type II toxin-antitoxin system RelE/ParE family toxin [Kordia antarctica]QHI35188.1 hypothetical protein IMCC3317_05340 [Kordia antarctica]
MDFELKLTLDVEAQIEIEKAIEYYETLQEGLGREFYYYLEGYFKTLQLGNVFFQIKRKPVFRELALKRFPYVIIYEHIEDEIYIYSVFNTQQNPKKKKRH